MKPAMVLMSGVLVAMAGCAPPPPAAPPPATSRAAAPRAASPGTPPAATPAPDVASPAARWRTDPPLRAGMARVRAATDALAHAGHGHLDRAQERALADEIAAAVNTMFAQCRLAPAPDAALHPLLARLLVASQALRERSADAEVADVAAELRAVLQRYDQLFDDSPLPAGEADTADVLQGPLSDS